ncbi:MAG: hypothetical protein R3Y05_00330 [bacterium]
MAYPINKKKLPRKKTDAHIIHGILRAINENFHISSVLLHIDIRKFDAFVGNLIKDECIQRVTGKDNDQFDPEDFILTIKGISACKKIKNATATAEVILPFFKFSLGTKL